MEGEIQKSASVGSSDVYCNWSSMMGSYEEERSSPHAPVTLRDHCFLIFSKSGSH